MIRFLSAILLSLAFISSSAYAADWKSMVVQDNDGNRYTVNLHPDLTVCFDDTNMLIESPAELYSVAIPLDNIAKWEMNETMIASSLSEVSENDAPFSLSFSQDSFTVTPTPDCRSIEIYSLNGQKVMSIPGNEQLRLSTADWDKDTYIVSSGAYSIKFTVR